MQVIILSDVYLPFLSGVSTVTHVLSEELPRYGLRVNLVIPSPSFHIGEIYRFDERYGREIVFVPSTRLFRLYDNLRFPARFFTPRVDESSECIFNIHSPMLLGTSIIKNLRRKRDKMGSPWAFVGVFHTRMSEYLLRRVNPNLSKKLARLLDFYTRNIFKRMDVTIVLSKYMKKMAERLGIPNTIILPNPLNRGYYAKPKYSIDKYYDMIEPGNYFLYLGRISHEKKVDVLADLVCRKKAPYSFVFAGEGPLLEELKSKYMDTNCIFLGRVPFKAQKPLYRDAIALVSASDWETQGMVFLEAMAQGTPVIASILGGQTDFLVNDYNSLLFSKDSEIPKLMDKLRSNPVLREELGYNARITALRFHPERIIPKYIKLFEILLEKAERF